MHRDYEAINKRYYEMLTSMDKLIGRCKNCGNWTMQTHCKVCRDILKGK